MHHVSLACKIYHMFSLKKLGSPYSSLNTFFIFFSFFFSFFVGCPKACAWLLETPLLEQLHKLIKFVAPKVPWSLVKLITLKVPWSSIELATPKVPNLIELEAPRVDPLMGSHDTCGPWVLPNWFNDAKVEKWLGKLDDPSLDLDLDKEATLSKFDDAKLDLKSNYTFAKSKELEKKNLYSKFGGFRGGIVWSTNYFMHEQIETRKVMNPSTLNPWKLKSSRKTDNANSAIIDCIGKWTWKLRGSYFENCKLLSYRHLRNHWIGVSMPCPLL